VRSSERNHEAKHLVLYRVARFYANLYFITRFHKMPRSAIFAFCLFCSLTVALGYPWYHDYRDYYNPDDLSDVERSEILNVQRRSDWCARWGDNCVPNARVKFAKCCDDLVCSCTFTTNKCQCKRPSILGRRWSTRWSHTGQLGWSHSSVPHRSQRASGDVDVTRGSLNDANQKRFRLTLSLTNS